MGDLNDYPSNKSVQLIMEKLYPKITSTSNKFGGTHNYRGEWNILDHICISKGARGPLFAHEEDGTILTLEYLLSTYKGNIVPFRTFEEQNISEVIQTTCQHILIYNINKDCLPSQD